MTLLTPADIARKPRSVGRPVFAVEVEAVDDADRPLPPGEVGRLRYRGPGVAIGYHGIPRPRSRRSATAGSIPAISAASIRRGI